MIGVIACTKDDFFPFGKQTFFFEEMLGSFSHKERKNFIFYDPLQHDDSTKTFSGFQFDETWCEAESGYPGFIYDRAFSSDRNQTAILDKYRDGIAAHGACCLNPPELSKLLDCKPDFNDFLAQNNFPYLPHWFSGDKPKGNPESIYIKPFRGSGGRGIRKSASSTGTGTGNLQNEVRHFMYQEAGRLLDAEDHAFDLRILIQAVGSKYEISGSAIRMGMKGSVVSNLQSGGTAFSIEEFQSRFPAIAGELESQVSLAKRISMNCMEKLSEQFGQILEIGFDILLTRDRGPVFLEANSRPSRWMFTAIADRMESGGENARIFREMRRNCCTNPGRFLLNISSRI